MTAKFAEKRRKSVKKPKFEVGDQFIWSELPDRILTVSRVEINNNNEYKYWNNYSEVETYMPEHEANANCRKITKLDKVLR
jgi:hypothetical protein